MDASPREQAAVRAYVRVLPNPFPMLRATERVWVVSGQAVAFVHPDRGGKVWVVWAVAGGNPAEVEVPVRGARALAISNDGHESTLEATAGKVRLHLAGDKRMPPPVLVIDRSPDRRRP
jgi:hypothetical protein